MGQKRRRGNASVANRFPEGAGLFATFSGLVASKCWSALGGHVSPEEAAALVKQPSLIIDGLRKGFAKGQVGCSMEEAEKAIGKGNYFFSGPIFLHSSFHSHPNSVVLGRNHQEPELLCRWLRFVPWSPAKLRGVRETHALIAVPTYSIRWLAYIYPDVLPGVGQAVVSDEDLDRYGVLPQWWLVRKAPIPASMGKTYGQQEKLVPAGEQQIGVRELTWMIKEVQRGWHGSEAKDTLTLDTTEVRCPDQSATLRGSNEKLRVTVRRERSGGAIRFSYLGDDETRPHVGLLTAMQPEFPHPMDSYR